MEGGHSCWAGQYWGLYSIFVFHYNISCLPPLIFSTLSISKIIYLHAGPTGVRPTSWEYKISSDLFSLRIHVQSP